MAEIRDDTQDVVVVDNQIADTLTDATERDTIQLGEVQVIDRTAYKWLEYTESDWVQTSSYYKLVIPYATHKCVNAYVATMMIGSTADSGDVEDVNGLENNIATWKLLPNDTIVVKADEPVDCKILIKGEK